MCRIILQPIAEASWRATLTLAVRPDQQRFVADVVPIAAIVLAKAFIRPGGKIWQPYAIYADETLIGLVALAFTQSSRDDYWIYHFFIDQRYQGQGHGSRSLQALLRLVAEQHPQCRVLQLTVHPENHPAQRLYIRAGFEPSGEEFAGEPVYRYRMPDTDQGASPDEST
ncbi:MAG TPA: GNAT family N-acetyltransferase [Herpetosiphonaceae bacterium]